MFIKVNLAMYQFFIYQREELNILLTKTKKKIKQKEITMTILSNAKD